jgi:hypothetical protein
VSTTSYVYDSAVLSLMNEEIDWVADTIKVMLCTSTYAPAQATHQYKSDVTNEISDASYTAGGKALTKAAAAMGTRIVKYDVTDVTWTALTAAEIRYLVFYDDTPAGDGAKPLIGYVDLGQNVASVAADFIITFHADGLLVVEVA